VLLQETLLFAASIRDNIAYGAPDVDAAEVEAAARLANAHGFIEEMPEGYETIVGERGVTLSNGQRQRIAIARAAIRQSPILILDEPTTGLDEENQRDVIEALERLSQGRTTFLITHDLRTASRCHMIVLLHNRRIVERGSHEELMRAQGRYAMLFDLEASENHARVAEEGSIAVTR
jgi:ATP-binding cassette subfamily B protein